MFLDDRLKLLRMSRDIKLSPQDTEGKCTLYASGKPILFLRVVEGEGVTFDLSVPSEILEHLDRPAPDPGMWRICCQAQERAKRPSMAMTITDLMFSGQTPPNSHLHMQRCDSASPSWEARP